MNEVYNGAVTGSLGFAEANWVWFPLSMGVAEVQKFNFFCDVLTFSEKR
jgi:hypothetical protein